jgi:hypothetical protein
MVVTKADLITDAQVTTSDEIVSWLERNGLDNLVRSVINDFHEVTFVASAIVPEITTNGSAVADQAGIRHTVDWILAVSGLHPSQALNETVIG